MELTAIRQTLRKILQDSGYSGDIVIDVKKATTNFFARVDVEQLNFQPMAGASNNCTGEGVLKFEFYWRGSTVDRNNDLYTPDRQAGEFKQYVDSKSGFFNVTLGTGNEDYGSVRLYNPEFLKSRMAPQLCELSFEFFYQR